jgi:hypothetical protein
MDQATSLPPFDVSLFEAADTAILEVMNQNDEPLLFAGKPVRIELYGPGSEQASAAQAKVDRASQQMAFAAAVASGKGKKTEDNTGEMRRLQVDKLTACTKELINFPIEGGARALYENRKLGYITRQVEKFLGDWANFPSASTRT